jgi:hypothetical protein
VAEFFAAREGGTDVKKHWLMKVRKGLGKVPSGAGPGPTNLRIDHIRLAINQVAVIRTQMSEVTVIRTQMSELIRTAVHCLGLVGETV